MNAQKIASHARRLILTLFLGVSITACMTPDQKDADHTLVYLLAHASTDAAQKSFDTFRADPEWIAAKKASEEKGGGSLTVKDGVKSVFLKATDYSPTK